MSNKIVVVNLTPRGIDEAIDRMKAIKRTFEDNCFHFRHAVAERVMKNANDLYAQAWYNDWVGSGKGPALVPMIIEETEEASILVAGSPAIFIEFGAGIYHNGGTIFTSLHPYGVQLGFTIASYPEHGVPSQGRFNAWEYDGRITHGTEAQLVLYNAVRYTLPDIEDIAREIFDDD